MARRSLRSDNRPDTLMQDRPLDEVLLQRTAGPYIWVSRTELHYPRHVCSSPNRRYESRHAGRRFVAQADSRTAT